MELISSDSKITSIEIVQIRQISGSELTNVIRCGKTNGLSKFAALASSLKFGLISA